MTKLDQEIENYSLSQKEWNQIIMIQNLLKVYKIYIIKFLYIKFYILLILFYNLEFWTSNY